jgi:integrase
MILAARRRLERQQVRQALGTLRDRLVTAGTAARYHVQVLAFLSLLSYAQLPRSLWDLDELLSARVEAMWEEGDPKASASNLLAGMQHFFPPCRGHIPSAWRLLHAWNRAELPARAPPLTLEIVKGLAGLAILQQRLDVGVCLLMAFHCFLRTGEVVNLKAADIVLDRVRGRAVVNLGLTKGGIRRGAKESVTVHDSHLVEWISALLTRRLPGDSLLACSAASFRKYFRDLCNFFRLQDFEFKPYSLRRGGATYWFRSTNNLQSVIHRGRWENSKTARIYVTEGLSMLTEIALNPVQLRTLRESAAILVQPGPGAWRGDL